MKTILRFVSQGFAFVVICVFASSCAKDTEPQPNSNDSIPEVIPDFRESFAGVYECDIYYVYKDSAGTFITDTLTANIVSVSLFGESSIWVDSPFKSLEETYAGNNTFNCSGCNDYSQFYTNDSIFMMEKDSAMNTRYYWGHKML